MRARAWLRELLLVACLLLATAAQARGSGKAFVSSEKDGTLTMIDIASATVTGAQPVCRRPRHLQRTPDGARLLVACSDDHRVVAWDIGTGRVVDQYEVGEDPEVFDLSPDGRMLYVANEEDAALTAYDLVAKKKAFTVRVGGEPEGVKLGADGQRVYVTSEVAGMVHVIDVARRAVVKNIAVGKRPRRLALAGGELWVTNELDASVSIIRAADDTVVGTLALRPPGMRAEDVTPVGLALSPDGRTFWIGLGRANHVAEVDVATRAVRRFVLVGKRAWGVAVSRDGRRVFVTNGLSDDVSVVDTSTGKAVRTLPAGRVPHSVVLDD